MFLLRTTIRHHGHPLVLVVASLALYLTGLPPSITWAHDAADGPELAAAVVTWGVPHPPGYPTFVLLGRLFLFLPWGDPAHRLAAMSALAATLAVGILWYLIRDVQLLRTPPGAKVSPWPATLGATALATSPVFWSQALVVEVYALNALLTAGVLFLVARWLRRRQSPPSRGQHHAWLIGAAFLLGLGLGNHLTIAALLPLVAVVVGWEARRRGLAWRGVLGAGLALLAGLGLYLYLPLSAAQDPPINWGLPSSLRGFLWTVTAAPYRGYTFALPISELPDRLLAWLRLAFVEQFTLVGAGLALLGAWHLGERSRPLLGASGFLALLLTLYAITYNTGDSYVYLIPAFMVMSLWIALGLAWILEVAAQSPLGKYPQWTRRLPWVLGLALLLAISGANLVDNYQDLSLRGDRRAYAYAQEVFRQAEPQAVILAGADLELFPLWYFRYALHQRPDVTVVSAPLLQYDWYLEHLRRRHPTLLPPTLPPDAQGRLLGLVASILPRYPIYATSRDEVIFRRYQIRPLDGLYQVLPPPRALE